jgi:hypothetical protein
MPWALNSQLLFDEVLTFVRILLLVSGAAMALLLLVSLMFALERTKDEAASRHGVTDPGRWRLVDGYLNRANRKSTGL